MNFGVIPIMTLIFRVFTIRISLKFESKLLPTFIDSNLQKMNSIRMQLGQEYLKMMWYFVADRIVHKAIEYYHLNEEQADALKSVYLRAGNYIVQPKPNLLQ